MRASIVAMQSRHKAAMEIFLAMERQPVCGVWQMFSERAAMSSAIVLLMGYEAFSSSLAVIAAAGLAYLGKGMSAE